MAPSDHQQLFVSLYDELRRLAQRKLRQGGAANSMGATTLLHEVYLTVHARDRVVFPGSRTIPCVCVAGDAGLIIDYARSRQALKRGRASRSLHCPRKFPNRSPTPTGSSRRSDTAWTGWPAADSLLAEVVDLKYFGGFVCRDCRDVGHVGAHCAAGLGEGADLPA